MQSKAYASRQVSRLRKELKDLEADFFHFDPNDLADEFYALKRKKEHLIRSIVLELHLGIEDLLKTLLICAVVLPDGVKKKFPISRIKPELHELMSGDRAIGFATNYY
jgi:hypothetical protein